MFGFYKYDVALSFAEEDVSIVDKIVEEFKKAPNIKYYDYREHNENFGKPLLEVTIDTYGKRSRFVLVIISERFSQKYWANIERQVALATRKKYWHILPLQIDNTIVSGIQKEIIHIEWNNNPKELSKAVRSKIKEHKANEFSLIKRASCILLFFLLCITVYLFSKPAAWPPKFWPTPMERILITQPVYSATNSKNISTTGSFYISNTEVTVAAYRQYCNSAKKEFPPQPNGFIEDGPVVNVSWIDAQNYCTFYQGRLPTALEWEFAAKGGQTTKYSGGNNAIKAAVYNRKKPSRVGSRLPNQFGIYDMSGNVAEWCNDESLPGYKIVKGGAYNSPISKLQIACTEKEKFDTATPYIGFRIVWDKK